MLSHLLTLTGIVIFVGIGYLMSAMALTGTQLFFAIIGLIIVYAATVIWYIYTNL
jgi:hypothetical protein